MKLAKDITQPKNIKHYRTADYKNVTPTVQLNSNLMLASTKS